MFVPVFQPVNPGQKFRNGIIEFGRDVLINIELHQQGNQLWCLVDVNSGISGAGDNRFCRYAPPLGQDLRSILPFLIGQGYRFL